MATNYDDFIPSAEDQPQRSRCDKILHSAPDAKADAAAFFAAFPWARKIPIFGSSVEGYGPKTTLSLAMSYIMVKGIADQVLSGASYAMLVGRYGIDAQRYQRLSPISGMGWSIKALTAMLCDAFAFLGYTKRWYMFLSCVLGGVFALIYALLPAKESSANVACAFIFLSSFGKANVDILSEGHYSRLIRRVPEHGPALVSFIWWFIMVGAVVAAAINGPLADQGKQVNGIFASGGLQIAAAIIYVFNWYGELTNREERIIDARVMHAEVQREQAMIAEAMREEGGKGLHPENSNSDAEIAQNTVNALNDDIHNDGDALEKYAVDKYSEDDLELPEPIPCLCGIFEFNKEVAIRNWRVFVYSIVMTCGVIAMTCGNILAETTGMLTICLVVSVICCAMSFWALPMVIAKANVFAYLQMVLYMQLRVVDNYYLADAECLPGGPNFTYTFYQTIGSVIGNAAGLVGVTCFNFIFSKRKYRVTFIVTTLAQIIAALFDIVIVERWNIAIGIPDHAMYICGDAVIGQVVYMIAWMPMVVLLSRLCPRGSESVVYALMAGFSNLGQSTSAVIGSVLIEYRFPIKSRVPCDFSNLLWLLIIGHICLPLIIIPLTLLLPNVRICDDIHVDHDSVKEAAKQRLEQAPGNGEPIREGAVAAVEKAAQSNGE